jgi:hypothetical protein
LLSSTVRAALGAAHSPAAAAVSAQAAALAQGVIQTMFLAKVKGLAVGLLVLAFVGTGAGVVTYRAQAQDGPPTPSPQNVRAAAQAPARGEDPAQLKREIERLRLELEQTRLLLKHANQEILQLRAARKDARAAEADVEAARRREAQQALAARQQGEKRPDIKQGVFSPDRRLIATAHQKFVSLHDAQTGKELRRFLGHTDAVNSVAFSPDGKLLVSGGKDQTAVLWDVASGKQLFKFNARAPVETVAFTPDGRRLLLGHRGQTSELDVPTGKLIRVDRK